MKPVLILFLPVFIAFVPPAGANPVPPPSSFRCDLPKPVLRVDAVEGPAARAGLREGDVIVAFDNQEVTDAKQFATLVKKAEGSRPVPLVVNRGGSTNLLVLRPR